MPIRPCNPPLSARASASLGIVSRNVATLVESPRVAKHEIRPLQPDQARALLDGVRLHRLGALFTVALALGLRQGEALGLKWNAVDFLTGVLHVRTTLQRVGKEWRLVEPKSERSRRAVASHGSPSWHSEPIGSDKRRNAFWRARIGPSTGLVFTTPSGTPIEPSNLTKTFKRLLRTSGLPDVRFHDLRHTAATFCSLRVSTRGPSWRHWGIRRSA